MMFDRLLNRITRKSASVVPPMHEADSDLLFGALLVRLAQTDRLYMFEEAHQIERIFVAKNDLTPQEAEDFRYRCEALEVQIPSTIELAGILRAHTDKAQRTSIVAALWSVVFADQMEHVRETELLNMMEDLLGVDHADSLALRDIEAAKAIPTGQTTHPLGA